MTLILKSNAAINLKGKIFERVSGAKITADFRDGNYKVNDISKPLTDIITVIRAQEGGSYDALGVYSELPANTPKLSVDQQTLKKGLLIEQGRRNLLLNSAKPVTQTVSVSLKVGFAYVLRVIGSGSATIKRGVEVLGVATEDSPKVLLPTVIETAALTIEVAGTLSYFELYETRGARKLVTKMITTTAAKTFAADDVEINKATLQSILPDFTGCVVMKQSLPDDLFDRSKTSNDTGAMLTLCNSDITKGVFVGRLEPTSGAGITHRVRFNGATEVVASNYLPLSKVNIFAINFSDSGVKVYRNGALLASSTMNDLNLSRIKIGFNSWSTAITQYIEQIAIYDRQLTDDELVMITTP